MDMTFKALLITGLASALAIAAPAAAPHRPTS
jgi:hypothetical protein